LDLTKIRSTTVCVNGALNRALVFKLYFSIMSLLVAVSFLENDFLRKSILVPSNFDWAGK
jgi:hypothetical protein